MAGAFHSEVTKQVPLRALIVDDEPVILQVLSEALADAGIEVGIAETAEAGLARLEAEPFGCLITDKNLPGMDGLELMRRTRAALPYCACILMTGYASTESAIEALQLGATDYIKKPIDDVIVMGERVERFIRGQQLACERDLLRRQIAVLRDKLGVNQQEMDRQKTEIELFNEILEQRVHQATEDQRQQLKTALEQQSGSAGTSRFVVRELTRLLKQIDDASFSEEDPSFSALSLVSRIRRRLKDSLEMISGEEAS